MGTRVVTMGEVWEAAYQVLQINPPYPYKNYQDLIRRHRRYSWQSDILAQGSTVDPSDTVWVYGIPRGGVIPAFIVADILRTKYQVPAQITQNVDEAHIIVDDIVDSGKTKARYMEGRESSVIFINLFGKGVDWLIFPWEGSEEGSAEDIPIRLLQFVGEDPTREGLKETPRRFLEAMKFWTSGYEQDPGGILKSFEDGAEQYDELIFQGPIPVYSLCEHHLAPFFGSAFIGYIPNKRIVGLSKFTRLVEVFSRRLQVQERLTSQIAQCVMEQLNPKGVAVVLQCRHLCMESRGVQRVGIGTTTSSMFGSFRDEPEARDEFLRFLGRVVHLG